MSIVAVHGPNTFGSQAVIQNPSGSAYATVDPANGLIWTLKPRDTSQVAANYDWAFTGTATSGGPSPVLNTMNPVITFAAGAHTVTLTLNNVAQDTFVINAVAGAGPTSGLMSAPPDEGEEALRQAPEEAQQQSDVDVGYDPAAHTVDEVKEFVNEHPDEVQAIYDAEVAGKNRATLISWLEESTPYDPADYTVAEVEEYVNANPELAQDVLDAETAGKNRVTLVDWLEDKLTSSEE